jgi:methanogenic corrinoid protein MtbC1
MIEVFKNALLAMDREQAAEVLRAGAQMQSPLWLLESVMVPALEVMGKEWEEGRTSLSQVYMSGRICEELIERLLPFEDREGRGHPPMALVVLEDYHMLGRRLVSSVLKANRFLHEDYGRMTVEEVVERVARDGIEILLISTLMLPSALRIKDLVARFAERQLDVKIVAGGAPFRLDKNLYLEVGADATAEKASGVIEAIRAIAGEGLCTGMK